MHGYFNVSGDTEMFKTILKYFEVEEKVDFCLCVPLDFVHGHLRGEGSIENVAVDVAGTKLFDFGEIYEENGVDPFDDFLSCGEVATFEHIRYDQ